MARPQSDDSLGSAESVMLWSLLYRSRGVVRCFQHFAARGKPRRPDVDEPFRRFIQIWLEVMAECSAAAWFHRAGLGRYDRQPMMHLWHQGYNRQKEAPWLLLIWSLGALKVRTAEAVLGSLVRLGLHEAAFPSPLTASGIAWKKKINQSCHIHTYS